jgi:hypothetical protein
MKHSAQGLGRFELEEMVPCQMEGAAPESGGGDPQAKEWNWNSSYWRKLGTPRGGTRPMATPRRLRSTSTRPSPSRLLLQGRARVATFRVCRPPLPVKHPMRLILPRSSFRSIPRPQRIRPLPA